ncbi:MAG: acetate/propionate family kinase [Myxococcales bacterium]|nr:acetate/propionate family kinase [Myxococcales bacterium]
MHILVINCGSSSIKADIIQSDSGERIVSVRVERVGTDGCFARWDGADPDNLGQADHAQALGAILPAMLARAPGGEVAAVGHRVVHGGETFRDSAKINDEAIGAIEAVTALAPLHNPANLAGIRSAMTLLPDATHVAVFDTAFHSTLPRRAYSYAIPQELADKHQIRRYGFHGTSHRWVAEQAAKWLDTPMRDLRIITCHLGNGSSVCAVEFGRSVETSMGMTPLEGLVMGTRSGDLDPGAVLYLVKREGLTAEDVDELLNRKSGLAGLSGQGNDLRDIERRAAEGDDRCRTAITVYAHRLRKYIGSYAAVMGGVDAIVFTGGIGQNSEVIRHRAAQRLGFLGARIDEDRNRDCKVSAASPVFDISNSTSRVKLLAVATDEELAIARDAARIHREQDKVTEQLQIPIAVSARHIHLTREAVDQLFGEGHQLTPYKPLSQPGQFACEEKLDLVGPKRTIKGVRILGPERRACQVEVSRTDEFALGIDAPVRGSGDVKASPGITLKGPKGTLTLQEGLICAWRHIHMTPEDAKRFGVKNRDIVDVRLDTDGRDLVFGDVLVRVSPKYKLEMHIDTDEANAAEITRGVTGVLAGTSAKAQVVRKRSS